MQGLQVNTASRGKRVCLFTLYTLSTSLLHIETGIEVDFTLADDFGAQYIVNTEVVKSDTIPIFWVDERCQAFFQPFQFFGTQVTFENAVLHAFAMIFQGLHYFQPPFIVAEIVGNEGELFHGMLKVCKWASGEWRVASRSSVGGQSDLPGF